MKKINIIYYVLIGSLIVLLFIGSCNEYKEPPMITEPVIEYADNPTITAISPSEVAVAGVRDITISGTNFATDGGMDTTIVYIGGELANIKNITSNQIVIYRPVIFGENLMIRVVVPSALNVGGLDGYDVEEPILKFGDFSRQAYDLYAIAVSETEDLYIATSYKILHLTSDGINLKTMAILNPVTFGTITDMKCGPGGYLYLLTGRKKMYRLMPNPDITDSTYADSDIHYADLSKNSEFFDFDANDNIFFGRRDGLWKLHNDTSESYTGYYDDIPIKAINVFNGYVYVATAGKLSRNQIIDQEGNLGPIEEIVDIKSKPSWSSAEISSFTMDENGNVMFCLKYVSGNSIFILEQDGSVTPYYINNILPTKVDQIVYGQGNHIFLNRGITLGGSEYSDSVRVYKMGMQFESAPRN